MPTAAQVSNPPSPPSAPLSPPSAAAALQWQRLSLLEARFRANVAAVKPRLPALAGQLQAWKPAQEYLMAFRGNQILLARLEGTTAHIIPCALNAAAAQETLLKIYPTGHCTEPLLVAGIDQGWLWHFAFQMKVSTPALPEHTPPLYFLARQVEELWVALHLHDWHELLTDERVRLFAGDDAVAQFQESLQNTLCVPWPRVAVTLDPKIWPDTQALDGALVPVQRHLTARLEEIKAQYPQTYGDFTPPNIAQKLRSGGRLRILGITSRYTTFLQYSMRDWLAGCQQLGHETKLLIEEKPHEILTPMSFADTCGSFKPDVIFLIDHCRAEFGGALPTQVPSVMWVQDRLPNIFGAEGGAAQGPRDYCLGFGRLHLSGKYGYPARRYMAATMGVNDQRFGQTPGEAELAPYRCDVSYVSHASVPADVLLKNQADQMASPAHRQLLHDVYERMAAHYQAGGEAFSDIALRILMENVAQSLRMNLAEVDVKNMVVFFNQQINNALFRHQTLIWLAESGVDLRLYGRGWEKHPRLAPFARGVADNTSQLGLIYRASKINIQVTPHGAVHQRLLDGIVAGAFFLLRWHPGDAVGPLYQELYSWCQTHGIASDAELQARADIRIQSLLTRINELEASPADRREMSFFDVMQGHRDTDFMTAAASIWPEYNQVAFNTRAELRQRLEQFLNHPPERQRIAAAMRQAVVDRVSYTSITRRLMNFIADDLTAPGNENALHGCNALNARKP